jgi:hypothetical protein
MGATVDAHAIITALLNDAIKDEAFEKAIQYRKYRDLLDQLKSAIQAEEFDKCIELKKIKSELELAMPEFDEKRKLLESLPPPPTTAPPKKLAGDVSQSDDSDESVVKGGKLASAATATAKARLLSGSNSAAASPSAAAAAPGAASAAGAKPVVKLSAAELEARWAKFAPKPLGGPARGAGAAMDDSAINRTSWDGGFTLQNAKKAAASPAPAADDDDDDKATLDEESGSVLESKKPKKKKKDKADKDEKEKKKKKALPPKKSKIMSSTWAADLGGASFAELAKEKASAKAARTTDVKKKKKKKVKGLAMVTDAIKPKRAKQAADDSEEVDSDLVAPKSALKVGGNAPQPQSPTGGLSRAKDAPDAETSRRAYELRLAQARSVNAAKVDSTANAAKDAAPGASKKVGFIELFKSKK